MKSVGTKLRDDVYRALIERARREGVTVSEFVRRAVLAALNLPTPAQPEAGDRLSALERRVGELEERVATLEQAVSREPLTSTASRVAASTGSVAGGSDDIPSDVEGSTAPQVATTVKAKPGERRRVIVFGLEWAGRKGINVEEYMARKEREGYICNEAGRKVYCVWREDLEGLVATLNSAGAKTADLEKTLSGRTLETARAAVEAGLLWYDSKEKRWKAPL